MPHVQGDQVQALVPRALSARGSSIALLLGFLLALLLPACRGPAVDPPRAAPIVSAPVTAQDPAAAAVVAPPVRIETVPGSGDGLAPDILRPSSAEDGELARVGDRAVHKRHAYDRLLETNPQQARDLVDNLVLDLLVADLAERFGIRVDVADVAEKLADEERELRQRLQVEWKGQLDYDRYLLQQFGMDAAEYGRWRRLTLARTLYRQYVIRYHAMLSERVQVRCIVGSDRKPLEELRQQVVDGASFSRLALRHSEDESRKEGGLLPAFGRGTKHPAAEVAFTLAEGEVSQVFERQTDGQTRYYLLTCLRRLPARSEPFAAVRAELDEDIKARPLSRFDFHAFYFQVRGAAESGPDNGGDKR